MPVPPHARLPRTARLTQGRHFATLRERGQRLARGCLIANWLAVPGLAAPQLGVITSRKVGGAVLRARARRLLREAFRRHQHELNAPVQIVLVARPSIVGRSFAAVEADYLGALRRAGLLLASA